MTGPRRYALLCPIGRALDRVGDRWTLLILRDLHAGPARFSELQAGLKGIAPNLLTDRLNQLIADGLVEKRNAEHGVSLYALTALGGRTRDLLFELAMFGGRFAADAEVRRPGNLRTIAVTLETACQRVVQPDASFVARFEVDGEPFTLTADDGRVTMRAGETDAPDVEMTTSYEPMIAASEGEMDMEKFVREHVRLVTHTPGKDRELLDLLGGAMRLIDAIAGS